MKKLNRKNADIEKLRDKKVAVRLVGKDAEIDFRKWLEENGINFNNEDTPITNRIINEICYYVEGNNWDWCYKGWFIQKGYTLYEWEIAEEEKTYTIKDVVETEEKICTIKDVVENEGKVYKCITDSNNGVLYKCIDDVLYATYNRIEWKKSLVKLRKLLKYEFIEYKPEPKKITFEEALKEMETKVCRCLFSNRCITIKGSQFIDVIDINTAGYTSLSVSEIKSEWVVVNE